MTINKYVNIGKINFSNSISYFGDIFAKSVFIGVIIFIFINLWKAIFGVQEFVNGFTIYMMVWYLVMTEAIVTCQGRVVEEIGEEIRSGEISNYLNKPYNYILYKYAASIGNAIYRFVGSFLIGGIVAYIFLGGISVNALTLIPVGICVILAISLHFVIMAFLGIFAFWFEETRGLYFIYQKFVFTIGGMLFPLDVFPLIVTKISNFLPFAYICYYPAKLFVMFDMTMFIKTLCIQLFWIAFFIGALTITYRICVKKLSINGG